MSRPSIELATLLELEADPHGCLDYDAARDATAHVDAAHGRALIVIRGVLRFVDPRVVRVIGAALYDAHTIEVFAKGPKAVELAEAIGEAAEEERGFRRPGQAGAA